MKLNPSKTEVQCLGDDGLGMGIGLLILAGVTLTLAPSVRSLAMTLDASLSMKLR